MSSGGNQQQKAHNGIGVRQESSLHAALKEWYADPDDAVEVAVDGYQIDVISGELLVEIQTGNFSAMRVKLRRLLPAHPVRLVYPIAREKWICREWAAAADQPAKVAQARPGRRSLHGACAHSTPGRAPKFLVRSIVDPGGRDLAR